MDTDKQDLEKKNGDFDKTISDTNGLVKMNHYNTEITETENKTPSVIGVGTTAALDIKVIEIVNKIPDIANLATRSFEYRGCREIKLLDNNN